MRALDKSKFKKNVQIIQMTFQIAGSMSLILQQLLSLDFGIFKLIA